MEVNPVNPIVGEVRKFGEIDAEGDAEVDKPSTLKPAPNPPVGRKRPVATGRLYKPLCEKCQKDNQDCKVATGGGSCVSCRWKKIRCMYGAKRKRPPPKEPIYVGDSPEETQAARRPALIVLKKKQKKTAPADAAREERLFRTATERVEHGMSEAGTNDEGPSVKAKGKRKIVESESDKPSSSKRRKDGEMEEQREQGQWEEWLEKVWMGTRIADRLGGVDPYKRFENLEREVIQQGELLSSICEYLRIPEMGIPRLPL
jgi:hypothetical protein